MMKAQLIQTCIIILFSAKQLQANSSSCACKNGGFCLTYDDINAGKEVYCECPKGFGGHLCELQKDECNSGGLFCFNGGSCEVHDSNVQFEADSDYYCECPQGFGGDHCEDKIQRCEGALSCFNGGTCVNNTISNSPLTKICECLKGYQGALCEIKAERCSSTLSCYNNGKCMLSDANTKYCSCSSRYGGIRCEYPKVQCEGGLVSCLNGGWCVDEDPSIPNSFQKCSCPPSFKGNSCQSKVIIKKKKISDMKNPTKMPKEDETTPKSSNDETSSITVREEILWTFFALFIASSFCIGFGAVVVFIQNRLLIKKSLDGKAASSLPDDATDKDNNVNIVPRQLSLDPDGSAALPNNEPTSNTTEGILFVIDDNEVKTVSISNDSSSTESPTTPQIV